MFVFDNITDLKKQLTANREEGLSIGFVPTMGALHKGHSSLIEQSLKENDITVCSIFVNPTQFNDKTDLKTYPRTLEADKKLLENTGCTILFVPSQVEIYPDALDGNTHTQSAMRNTDMHIRYKQVKLGKLDKVMEGASRHGHFDGVMQVVCRLFDIVEPDRAYFGQKDFQQQVIIKEMVRQLNYSIQIISCPIVREADGLAMSSRNMRLSDAERVAALIIPKTLFMVKSLSHKLSVEELTMLVENEIAEASLTELDYFEIVHTQTLEPITDINSVSGAVACIAVVVGRIRLIDNIILK